MAFLSFKEVEACNPWIAKRSDPMPTPTSTPPLHVLFICAMNRLRSPTAEQIFAAHPRIQALSAGLNHDAENPLTPDLVHWAQLIFVMENGHRNKLQKKFKQHINGQRIICLNIPDDYEFMDPELISLLKARVLPHLP